MNKLDLIKVSLEKKGYKVVPYGEVSQEADFPTNYKVTQPVGGQEKVVVVDSIGKVIGGQG